MQFGLWQKKNVINLCGALTAISLVSGCFGTSGYLDDYDVYVTNGDEEIVQSDAKTNDEVVAVEEQAQEEATPLNKEANGDVVASGPVKGLVADDDIEYDEEVKRKADSSVKSEEKAEVVTASADEPPLPEKSTTTPVEVAMVDKNAETPAKLEVLDNHYDADDEIVPESDVEETYEDEVMSKEPGFEPEYVASNNNVKGGSLLEQIEHELQYSDGGRINVDASEIASTVALTAPNAEKVESKQQSDYSLTDVLNGKKEEKVVKGKTRSLEDFDESMSGVSVHVATIYHPNGSADITAKGRKELAKIKEEIKKSGGTIRVIGHASSRTSAMDLVNHMMTNFEVSNNRAKFVAKQLIAMGVPAEKMFVGAVSDADPVYYEVMPEGEAMNRRTEIYLDY